MKIKNIVLLLILIAYTTMPVMAATGEENVKIITKDDDTSSKIESSDDDSIWDVDTSDSSGFNDLFMAPVTAVSYLMSIPPVKKSVIVILGLAFGVSFVLTLLSLAANNGRVATGGMLNNLQMMVKGKNNMLWVVCAFFGFLFAIALLKYLGSTSIF